MASFFKSNERTGFTIQFKIGMQVNGFCPRRTIRHLKHIEVNVKGLQVTTSLIFLLLYL